MQEKTVRGPRRRDTAWKRDGKKKGIYWRRKADGSKSWGYYAWGKINRAVSREAAIDAQAKARLDKSAGRLAPDTHTRVADLAEEVRAAKRRRLRPASLAVFEDALDRVVLPQVGQLTPAQVTPDRIARLIRDLEASGLSKNTIIKYLQPLNAVLALALRRGMINANPMSLLAPDERPQASERRKRFEWSPEAIATLIAAADDLAKRPEARYDYSPLLRLLALTGLRVSEALALRWQDVDLLAAELHVRHSLGRDKTLGPPKTAAGERVVPLSPGLVETLLQLKPFAATEADFVFAASSGGPLGYWNFRNRGFRKALEAAGLEGAGLTVHDLRHAAASLYIAAGMTPVDVAALLGHSDASITLKIYAHLFDRGDFAAKVRAAQASLGLD
jgi:integrase